jgi:hypothetical protein
MPEPVIGGIFVDRVRIRLSRGFLVGHDGPIGLSYNPKQEGNLRDKD